MINRVAKLREKMKEKEIDAVIITGRENYFYLSGFTGSDGCLLITNEKTFLITDFRYVEQAKLETEYYVIQQTKGILNCIKEIINELNINNIGFEGNNITFSQYERMTQKLEVNLISIDNMIENLRIIKQPNEIENIKKAVDISDRAFLHILNYIKTGVSEKDIELELEHYMKKNGAESLSFDTIVASGSRTSLPHATPTQRKFEYGDFVLLDFGCKVNGYCSDMTRTVIIGEANEEQKKIYNIVLEAQKKALDFIKAGKKTNDVDAIAREYIKQNGYGDNFGHGLGHSVGIEVHEEPRISPSCEVELKSGMVVTVEPGIYVEGFGGVRIEDLVIVTENGIENLNKSPKELIIL